MKTPPTWAARGISTVGSGRGLPEGLRELDPGARRELLRVLTSSSLVRADVIRQFHEAGKADMAELLMLLEEMEWARQAAIEELRADQA